MIDHLHSNTELLLEDVITELLELQQLLRRHHRTYVRLHIGYLVLVLVLIVIGRLF